ncbi:hypothetical protein EDB89DRAFT_2071986 [Lactarius sanguifluus]|nr:hypothetical protein EDB89DRAFT_2071986 [Lactarius sanguifluus]
MSQYDRPHATDGPLSPLVLLCWRGCASVPDCLCFIFKCVDDYYRSESFEPQSCARRTLPSFRRYPLVLSPVPNPLLDFNFRVSLSSTRTSSHLTSSSIVASSCWTNSCRTTILGSDTPVVAHGLNNLLHSASPQHHPSILASISGERELIHHDKLLNLGWPITPKGTSNQDHSSTSTQGPVNGHCPSSNLSFKEIKLVDIPPAQRFMRFDRIDWNRAFFKTYYEKRSFGHLLGL